MYASRVRHARSSAKGRGSCYYEKSAVGNSLIPAIPANSNLLYYSNVDRLYSGRIYHSTDNWN